MKKIILALATALLISGTAFAGRSGFEAGVAYGNISFIDKNNFRTHTDVSGWGFEVGYYQSLLPFVGLQGNIFCVFPGSVKHTVNGGSASDISASYKSPYFATGEAMVMLNLPIAILDLRAGAGISYTMHDAENKLHSTKFLSHYFAVPVSVAAAIHLGGFGLKAGCDMNFVFSKYITQDNKTEKVENDNLNTFIILPYVALTFNF